jgi:predicted Fe-Mo cluster-binding NifX family protein
MQEFEPVHFGDATMFHFYELHNEQWKLLDSIQNPHKNFDEASHGDKEKGMAIIALLKKYETQVLVSAQFGKNIKLINTHFIPVLAADASLDKNKEALIKNLKWMVDDLKRKPSHFKLFDLRHGNLKIQIK